MQELIMNTGLFRVVRLVLNLSLLDIFYNAFKFFFYRKRNIKCVKQEKIQYQLHDVNQVGIHSQFLHLRLS